jgi:DNA-binding transcriptional MerR regulator
MHQIGEVADRVGLSLRTIRHYEEVGLVPPSGRSAGGFRLYTDDDVERLRLVKHMKPLEFSLEEMRELLEARDRLADDPDDDQRGMLVDKLSMYAAAAESRCQKLRDQLDAAEAMAVMLGREASRRRRTSSGRRIPPKENPASGIR